MRGENVLSVRNLLKEWKVDIIYFQEIKLEVMSRSIVRSLRGCHHLDYSMWRFDYVG
jgi:hypothetical protein